MSLEDWVDEISQAALRIFNTEDNKLFIIYSKETTLTVMVTMVMAVGKRSMPEFGVGLAAIKVSGRIPFYLIRNCCLPSQRNKPQEHKRMSATACKTTYSIVWTSWITTHPNKLSYAKSSSMN